MDFYIRKKLQPKCILIFYINRSTYEYIYILLKPFFLTIPVKRFMPCSKCLINIDMEEGQTDKFLNCDEYNVAIHHYSTV